MTVAVAAALFFGSPLEALTLSVYGPPQWLAVAADRAVHAVWDELAGKDLPVDLAIKTLGLVAGRLFPGYSVGAELLGADICLRLKPEKTPRWETVLKAPPLAEPLSGWLNEDGEEIKKSLLENLSGVPYEALAWGGDALRDLVDFLMDRHMPGWKGTVVVRLQENRSVLELSVFPSSPLVLASQPRIYSGTLPNILRENLKESLIKDMSPLTGLPVRWVERHKDKIGLWAQSRMARRNTVVNSKAEVSVAVTPREIMKIDGTAESGTYVLRGWLAAYAGADGRPPEFGIHVGRFISAFGGWDWELYGEAILELDDWSLGSRLGGRWEFLDPLWLGVEYGTPDDLLWYGLWVRGNRRGPYLWWRYSQERDNQGAFGYRLNETVAVELHFDDRYEDHWSLRAIGDL